MSPSPPQIVVLGAGPTGLGVSLGLTLNHWRHPVTVVEKNSVPGGLAGSFSWNGHTVDYGPHRISPNLESIRALAEEFLGPDLLRWKSQHGVQIKKKCYQFPPRVVDWITPGSAWYMASLLASFAAGKISWVTHRFQADTFESMIVHKFGRKFLDSIAAPMAEKVWTTPNEIDPAFVDQRFALVRPFEVVKRLFFPRQELNPSIVFYPRRGFQQLWDAIAAHVTGAGQEVLTQTEPVRLDVENDRIVRIHLRSASGERVIASENLLVVSSIPITSLLCSLKGFPTESLLARAGRVKVRSMLLVMFELDQPKTLPWRMLFFPQREFYFNRLYEQNEYSRDTVQPGKSVIVADVTFPRGDPRMSESDDIVIAKTKADLAKLHYIPLERITAAAVRRVEFAYPVPDLVSRTELYHIQHELKLIHNLVVMGRFGVGEYDNSDYALDNGLTLAAMLAGRISRLDYLCSINQKRGRIIVG